VDPGLAYGLVGVLEILEVMAARGWSRSALVPHGGHRFALHLAAGLGLGGAEAYPEVFRPIGAFGADISVRAGMAAIPDVPGIGFEADPVLAELFARLIADKLSSVTP
jgi:L-alanine-DL-glutamate epimerase-like enolase superfamily enzyme